MSVQKTIQRQSYNSVKWGGLVTGSSFDCMLDCIRPYMPDKHCSSYFRDTNTPYLEVFQHFQNSIETRNGEYNQGILLFVKNFIKVL